MGIAFLLPWEKLPLWLLGPLLSAVGVLMLYFGEPTSGDRLSAGIVIAWGIGACMYGIRKLMKKDAVTVIEPADMK